MHLSVCWMVLLLCVVAPLSPLLLASFASRLPCARFLYHPTSKQCQLGAQRGTPLKQQDKEINPKGLSVSLYISSWLFPHRHGQWRHQQPTQLQRSGRNFQSHSIEQRRLQLLRVLAFSAASALSVSTWLRRDFKPNSGISRLAFPTYATLTEDKMLQPHQQQQQCTETALYPRIVEFGGCVLISVEGLNAETSDDAKAEASTNTTGGAAADSKALEAASQRLRVQLYWKGKRVTLSRLANEPVGCLLDRLRLSCYLAVSGSAGKQPKQKGQKQPKRPKQQIRDDESAGFYLATANGKLVAKDTPALDAFQEASQLIYSEADQSAFVATAALAAVAAASDDGPSMPLASNIARAAGENQTATDGSTAMRFNVVINPPWVSRVLVRYNLYAGCPILAVIEATGAEQKEFELRWYYDTSPDVAGYGPVFVPKEEDVGKQLRIATYHPSLPEFGQKAAFEKVLPVPQGQWHQDRMQSFLQKSKEHQRRGEFRVVSFNILASGYAQTAQADTFMFKHCPPALRRTAHRAPLLGREILQLQGDILCLQEWRCTWGVRFAICTDSAFDGTEDFFNDYLQPLMRHEGFSCFLDLKTKSSRVVEGCAMFLRNSRFRMVARNSFSLSEQLLTHEMFKDVRDKIRAKWPHLLDDVLPRLGTVVQLAAVEDLVNKSAPPLIVANTHLFFHPRASHIRILQLYAVGGLLAEFAKSRFSGRDFSVVLCGDLNCDFDSGGHFLLRHKSIPRNHIDWIEAPTYSWDAHASAEDDEIFSQQSNSDSEAPAAAKSSSQPPANATVDGLNLELPPEAHLNDCFKEYPMPFTNFVTGFRAALDHIFASQDFEVVNVLPEVAVEAVEEHGGLPCEFYPSDHLSIAVDLCRKQ